ncbi:MAG TPA: peptidylprolyl isomerase, partial [Pararhizobium sp.]|nr:peptidylprolyl isomerase [Pararhizobium sp.]
MRYSTMLAAALFAFAAGAQVPALAADQPAAKDAASGQQAATQPVDKNKVIATVGDMKITEGDVEMAEDSLDPQL